MTKATFPEVREALKALKCGKLSAHMGHVTSEETEDWRAVDINCNYGSNKLVGRPLARGIAAAVNAAPAMLAHIDAQAAEIERLREDVSRLNLFIGYAFRAHPNLAADIDALEQTK